MANYNIQKLNESPLRTKQNNNYASGFQSFICTVKITLESSFADEDWEKVLTDQNFWGISGI